jgi:hypothetical protein
MMCMVGWLVGSSFIVVSLLHIDNEVKILYFCACYHDLSRVMYDKK